VALVRGELLEELNIESEPWRDWVEGERERFRLRLTSALTRYAEDSTAAGLHDQAIAAARRLVHLDNLCEGSHRILMRALAAAGQRASALQQFRALTKILRAELAVGPDPETKALAKELGADNFEPPSAPRTALVPPPAPVPPPPAPLRPTPILDDWLTRQLEKLVAEIRGWQAGNGRLTRKLLDDAAEAMGVAALDRRRAAEVIEIADRAIDNAVAVAA
jgi:hypothetical protein